MDPGTSELASGGTRVGTPTNPTGILIEHNQVAARDDSRKRRQKKTLFAKSAGRQVAHRVLGENRRGQNTRNKITTDTNVARKTNHLLGVSKEVEGYTSIVDDREDYHGSDDEQPVHDNNQFGPAPVCKGLPTVITMHAILAGMTSVYPGCDSIDQGTSITEIPLEHARDTTSLFEKALPLSDGKHFPPLPRIYISPGLSIGPDIADVGAAVAAAEAADPPVAPNTSVVSRLGWCARPEPVAGGVGDVSDDVSAADRSVVPAESIEGDDREGNEEWHAVSFDANGDSLVSKLSPCVRTGLPDGEVWTIVSHEHRSPANAILNSAEDAEDFSCNPRDGNGDDSESTDDDVDSWFDCGASAGGIPGQNYTCSPIARAGVVEGCTKDGAKTVCLSYLEVLMRPSITGRTEFPKPRRLQVASIRRSRVPVVVQSSCGSRYRWQDAAAGLLPRADLDDEESDEDEDPYYARKRVGAIAYKHKPRGRDHK